METRRALASPSCGAACINLVSGILLLAFLAALLGCSTSSAETNGWKQYANRGGNSNIMAYQTGPDFIRVQFKDHAIYTYTYASAGKANIEKMKELAEAGQGLNSFIMTHVKYLYESKTR